MWGDACKIYGPYTITMLAVTMEYDRPIATNCDFFCRYKRCNHDHTCHQLREVLMLRSLDMYVLFEPLEKGWVAGGHMCMRTSLCFHWVVVCVWDL